MSDYMSETVLLFMPNSYYDSAMAIVTSVLSYATSSWEEGGLSDGTTDSFSNINSDNNTTSNNETVATTMFSWTFSSTTATAETAAVTEQQQPQGSFQHDYMNMDAWKETLALVTTTDEEGSYSTWTIFVTAITIYTSYSLVSHLISWYRFVAIWNEIAAARRMDRGDVWGATTATTIITGGLLRPRRRRCGPTFHQRLQQQVHINKMGGNHRLACPICLADFYECEFVTACNEGCGAWFHKECLFNWLDRSDYCPCCRKDLLNQPQGWLSTLLPSSSSSYSQQYQYPLRQ